MMEVLRAILAFGPAGLFAVLGVALIRMGIADRRRAKAQIDWVDEMRRKYPFLNTDAETPQRSKPDSGMEYAGNTGLLSLPDRIRVYAATSGQVQITLSQNNARLLADDLERGIAARAAIKAEPMTKGEAT
ncbi:hypothetical protein [Rhodobacter capsulatus]|uniref:hypothetical protein n=1 Tax=Rhodobacter capsulatus TaxID=1061 RepID=UPI004029D747